MFAIRLVHLIEDHADKLSDGLLDRLRRSDTCGELLSLVPAHELKHRAYEIYRNLTDWMLYKTESEIEEKYIGIGARRAHQGVPFSQLLYAIHATKQHLWEHLLQEGLLEPGELIGELDMLRRIEHFFDRAVYFAAIGHEGVIKGELVRAGMAQAPVRH